LGRQNNKALSLEGLLVDTPSLTLAQHKLFTPILTQKKHLHREVLFLLLLAHQGSNLDSSVPKTDVLPVTPWAKLGGKNKNI
tara:strand:- start:530 stop:775 length:246 start_codon:yes stop_codon:yes gene_type:complete